MAALMFAKPEPRLPKLRDRVTKADREYIFTRDGGCVMARFDTQHVCRTVYGEAHAPGDLRLLTIEHVKDDLRMGRRAPSDRRHMVALCGMANDQVPSKEARAILRLYLSEVEGVPMPNDRPLSAAEVAERLGLAQPSVKRIPSDELPYFRATSRGDRRYLPKDVQAYIERRMVR